MPLPDLPWPARGRTSRSACAGWLDADIRHLKRVKLLFDFLREHVAM